MLGRLLTFGLGSFGGIGYRFTRGLGGPAPAVATGAGYITLEVTEILTFDKGDLVPIIWTFTNADGDEIDPDDVYFRWTTPAGVTHEYHYDEDVELVRDSQGNYHVELDADEGGDWHYECASTGAGQAAAVLLFVVKPSAFN